MGNTTTTLSYWRFLRDYWRLLGFCLLATFCSSFGQTFYVALFNGHLQETFELSASQLAALYATATLISGAALPWVGALVDRMRLPMYTTLVFAGLAGSCLLMSWLPVLWMLLPAYVGLRLFGQGLMGLLAQTVIGRYFEEYCGRAAGISPLGVFLGQLLLPVSAVFAMQYMELDWRTTWLIAAVLIGLWSMKAHFFLHDSGGPNSYCLLHANYLQRIAAAEHSGSSNHDTRCRQWRRGEVLRDWRFHALLVSMLAAPFIVTGVLFNQVWLAEQKGWELTSWALGFVSYSVAAAAVSPLAGIAVDRIGAIRWIGWALLPMGVGLALFPFIEQVWGAHLLLGSLGLSVGMAMPANTPAWVKLYGTQHIGSIRAMVSAALVFSTAAAPLIFGLAIDLGGGLQAIVLISLALLLAAWLLRQAVLRSERA